MWPWSGKAPPNEAAAHRQQPVDDYVKPLDRHAAALAARGHWVLPRRLDGGTQMLIRGTAGWRAGGDPRRDGIGMALRTT